VGIEVGILVGGLDLADELLEALVLELGLRDDQLVPLLGLVRALQSAAPPPGKLN